MVRIRNLEQNNAGNHTQLKIDAEVNLVLLRLEQLLIISYGN